jgi:VWFA-related protein
MPRTARVPRLAGAFLSLALAFVAVGLVTAGWVPAAAPQDARSRERAMYVSVVDRDGKPVTGLPARDFVVREDGIVREVLVAEASDDPITLALLVDNSAASSPVIADVRRGLTAFVQKMADGQNAIAVTTFADRPTIQQDYTLVAPDLVRGVERLFPTPGSGAVLLQAIVETSKGFAKRDFDRGVMLAITTEGPDFSDLNEDQVLAPLRASGVAFHAFVFTARVTPDPRSDGVRQRMVVLDRAPRESGGRRLDLLTSMAIDDALAKLADQLTHEYKITYSRPEALIPPEKIEVSVKRAGLDARGTPVRQKPRG